MLLPSAVIYPLSLHDALPIWSNCRARKPALTASCQRNDAKFGASSGTAHYRPRLATRPGSASAACACRRQRSEEHTSELQSPCNLVCRLLLEKKHQTSRLQRG